MGVNYHDKFGQPALNLHNDIMTDDMVLINKNYGWFNSSYSHLAFKPNYAHLDWKWNYYYYVIHLCNQMLEKAEGLSGADQANVMSQACAMRAFCYFNLIRSHQKTYVGNENQHGVPLKTINPKGYFYSIPRATVK